MHFISELISGIFGLIFFIAYVILFLYALLDIFKNPNLNQTTKLLWVLIILVAPILGSLIYIFWGRNQSFL
ncbi:PLDc N-terminal domain-containing protein [Mucilaginibacter sp. AW1-3]